MRGERGSSSVEMVIALPIVLTVLFLAVQAGTWFHARSIALASAQSGARTSAMLNSSLEAGLSSARSFASDVGGTTLTGVTVTCTVPETLAAPSLTRACSRRPTRVSYCALVTP